MKKSVDFDSQELNDLYNQYIDEMNQRNLSFGEKDKDKLARHV